MPIPLDHAGASAIAAGQARQTHATLTRLTTGSGYEFDVRDADDGDEPALAEFFGHVTKEDLRFRFLSTMRTVEHARLALLTHTDHRRSESYLALATADGAIFANAMLAADDDLQCAEVAIVIRPEFKALGIGWRLLQHVSERAKAMGVRTLQAIESRDSHAAIEVERDLGFRPRSYPDDPGIIVLEKSLQPDSAEVA